MRVTYPLGWDNFTPEAKRAWWKRHVSEPMKEIESQVASNVTAGLKPFTNLNVPGVKKTLSEELSEIKAVFKGRI